MPILLGMKIAENNLKCEGKDSRVDILKTCAYWIVKGKKVCTCCKVDHERGRVVV